VNLCTSCGKDFGGVVAFDAHGVGKHAYDYSPQHPDGRRCLTQNEMREREEVQAQQTWSLVYLHLYKGSAS
jgi:hypothetical protein